MTCEASEKETFYGSTMGRRRGLVHISCELFLACVFVSSRDAPTLAITTTDLKPSGYPTGEQVLKLMMFSFPLIRQRPCMHPCLAPVPHLLLYLTLLGTQSHSGTRSAVNAVVALRHIPMVAS